MDPIGDYVYFFGKIEADFDFLETLLFKRVNLDTMTLEGEVIFSYPGYSPTFRQVSPSTSLIHPDGTLAYVADVRSSVGSNTLYKIDLINMTELEAIDLPAGIQPRTVGFAHPNGGFGFFMGGSTLGNDLELNRFNIDTGEYIDSTPIPGGWEIGSAVVVESATDWFAYLGSLSSPGVIHRVNLDVFEFGWESSFALDTGEDDLRAAALDPTGDRAYFGTDTSPGRIVTVDLAAFQRLDSVELDPIEQSVTAVMAHPTDGTVFATTSGGFVEDVQRYRFVRLAEIEGEPFVTTWRSNNPGTSSDTEIRIPATGPGYDYDIYWESIDQPGHSGWILNRSGSTTIDVEVTGRHEVRIYGDFPRIYFNNGFAPGGDRRKILSVEQWGDIQWTSMINAFASAENLVVNAVDAPDLSQVTSMAGMFRNVGLLNSDLSHWDVSNITTMDSAFENASAFDRNLGSWAIGNVTDMTEMLDGSGLSTSNYDATLVGWAAQNVQSGVTLGASGLEYCATAARQSLINQDGWSISGDSLAGQCAGSPPDVPVLSSPPDSATGISVDPVLSWQAASGADVYDLQVATNVGFTELVFDLTGLETTSRSLSDLDFLTLYYWRVRARNDAGASGYSTIRKFTTEDNPLQPPPVPVLLSPPDQAADVPTDTTLSWQGSPDATSYRLQVATNASFSEIVVNQPNIQSTSFQVNGLEEERLHYWRVRAQNEAGNSAYSTAWRFVTESGAPPAPDAPSLLSPSDTESELGPNVLLDWAAAEHATEYRVQVATDASFSQMVVNQSGVVATQLMVDDLDPGTDFYWRVRGRNESGNGPFSTTWRFSTSADLDVIFKGNFEAEP
ncbi:MAG: BspA family leucine-rich repeat surface protein [Wenzhouxiangella sp.]|nr:BspA family leucine-rich repeat surface protein [Wenzhouxiangella sp.]